MTNVIQIKRRESGGALVIGTAPLTTGAGGVKSGELVYDAIADITYIGRGNDGSGNSTSISLQGNAGAFVLNSRIAAVSGVASLDGTGKIPTAQLPASVFGANIYQGVWNASTNSPALASSVGTKGFWYKVSVAGATALDGTSNWNVGDQLVFDGTTWDKIDGPAEAVTTVAGRIGAIVISSTDISDAGVTGKALLLASTAAIAKTALSITISDVSGAAPLASPTFTGVPAGPTAAVGTNTTQIATTAFVAAAVAVIDGGVI